MPGSQLASGWLVILLSLLAELGCVVCPPTVPWPHETGCVVWPPHCVVLGHESFSVAFGEWVPVVWVPSDGGKEGSGCLVDGKVSLLVSAPDYVRGPEMSSHTEPGSQSQLGVWQWGEAVILSTSPGSDAHRKTVSVT